MKLTDEFGQEWFDYSDAVAVTPIVKRVMVREAVEHLRTLPRNARGYRSTYSATGDTLVLVAEHPDGSIEVNDCKVRAHTWDYKL